MIPPHLSPRSVMGPSVPLCDFSHSMQNFNVKGQKMTKIKWKNRIIKQLTAMGTDIDTYEAVIEALAAILAQRDCTREEFELDGARSVIAHTNQGGSTNTVKNPLLVLWDDLNKSALAYWRELGMTPSSYRKMTGDVMQKEKRPSLAAVLASIE